MEERRRRMIEQMRSRYQFSAPAKSQQKPAPVQREGRKVGRNKPCPCGSGKKYKKCHGSPAKVSA